LISGPIRTAKRPRRGSIRRCAICSRRRTARRAILKQNRELLDQIAAKLLEKETLSADELPKRVSFATVPAPAALAGVKRAGG
jgi:hypothetical protein